MALPSLVASPTNLSAPYGATPSWQAIRNTIAGKATEAHQLFQSTGVEEAEAFDKPNSPVRRFCFTARRVLSHLVLIPEGKLAQAVKDQLYSATELATVVNAAVTSGVISWARDGNTGRLPRGKMSAQSAVVKATAAGQLFYATGDGQLAVLAKGAAGQVLTTGNVPSWSTLPSSGVIDWAQTGNSDRLPRSKMSAQSAVVKATAAGQLFYATADGQLAALPKGTVGQSLVMNAAENAPEWGRF